MNLQELTKQDLKDYATTLGVTVLANDTKDELIAKIAEKNGESVPQKVEAVEGVLADVNDDDKLYKVIFHVKDNNDQPIYMCLRDEERVYARDEEVIVPKKFLDMLRNQCIKTETVHKKDKATGNIKEHKIKKPRYTFDILGEA